MLAQRPYERSLRRWCARTALKRPVPQWSRQGHYSVSFDRDFYAVFKAWASHSVGPLNRALNFAKAMRLDATHSTQATPIRSNFGTPKESSLLRHAIIGAFDTSQFSREPNTSKFGFTVLNWHRRIGALLATTATS